MATYGGYINGKGVTKTLREVLTAVDGSMGRGKLEDVEDSRLGIGHKNVGPEDSVF